MWYQAIRKLGGVLSRIPSHQYLQHVIPLLHRLCESDWHTARIAGTSLIGHVFTRLCDTPQQKQTIQRLFFQACVDDIPVVRRTAVITLGQLVASKVRFFFFFQIFHTHLSCILDNTFGTNKTNIYSCFSKIS